MRRSHAARPPRRVRRTGPVAAARSRRRELRAGGARRGGDRQDGAAGVRGRAIDRLSGRPGGRGAGGDGARLRGVASPVRADARRHTRVAGTPAGCAGGGVRVTGRDRAGPLSRRAGDLEPARRSRGDEPAGVPDRGRAVAGSRLGPGARVRRAPRVGRADRHRVRRSRAERGPRARRPAGAAAPRA